jgi:hypothetical protein
MTTGTENEQKTEIQQDQADAEAAFSASFEGKEPPAAAKPAETTEAQKAADAAAASTEAVPAASEATAAPATPAQASTTPAATPATTEAASTTTPSPKADENAELKLAMRRLEGRYGALNDQLIKLTATKEAEGKPAAATPVELAKLKAEYPEIAEPLIEDLAKVIGGLTAAKGTDPKEIETLVSQGVARETAKLRDAAVSDAHPNWKADLFTEDPVTKQKKPTADYLAWRTAIGEDEAKAFETSDNPYHVIRKLTSFYEWKTAAAKAEDANQKRLKAAVTPQGVPRASPPTISDDEAMRKGFEEGFNS